MTAVTPRFVATLATAADVQGIIGRGRMLQGLCARMLLMATVAKRRTLGEPTLADIDCVTIFDGMDVGLTARIHAHLSHSP